MFRLALILLLCLSATRQLARNPQDAQREDDENKSALFGPQCPGTHFQCFCFSLALDPLWQNQEFSPSTPLLANLLPPILPTFPGLIATRLPRPKICCRGPQAETRVRATPGRLGCTQETLKCSQGAATAVGRHRQRSDVLACWPQLSGMEFCMTSAP